MWAWDPHVAGKKAGLHPFLQLEWRCGLGPLLDRGRRRVLAPLFNRRGVVDLTYSRKWKGGVALVPSWTG